MPAYYPGAAHAACFFSRLFLAELFNRRQSLFFAELFKGRGGQDTRASWALRLPKGVPQKTSGAVEVLSYCSHFIHSLFLVNMIGKAFLICCCMIFGLKLASAQEEVDVGVGGHLELVVPDVPDGITDILVLDGASNKLAEWNKNLSPHPYYYGNGIFKKRVKLNTTRAMFTISNVMKQDRGNYTIEITTDNGQTYRMTFKVKVTIYPTGGDAAHNKTEVTEHRVQQVTSQVATQVPPVSIHKHKIPWGFFGSISVLAMVAMVAAVVWLVRHRAGRPAEDANLSISVPEVQVGVQQSLLDHPNGA